MFPINEMAQRLHYIDEVIFSKRMEHEHFLSYLRFQMLSSMYICSNSPYNIDLSLSIAPGLSPPDGTFDPPPLPEELLRKTPAPQKEPPPTVCNSNISPTAEIIINPATSNRTPTKISRAPKKSSFSSSFFRFN